MNFKKWIVITPILISLIFSYFTSISVSSPTPNLYVEPASTVVQVGEILSINVSITNVTDLCGWEIQLYYKNQFLNATSYQEGPFLKSAGSTDFYVPHFGYYNETHGLVGMICTLNDFTGGGVNGSGTLASITLKAINGGNSSLTLTETKLRDRNIAPIDHTTNDGKVQVVGISDIAITDVTPSKTIVGEGTNMEITATAENQGNKTETFNVTAYANTTTIQTKTVTNLPPRNTTTIVFTWNTTGFVKGNYTISAYAWPVLGETDTSDNNYDDGTIKLTIYCDVNGDSWVDMTDIGLACLAYGTRPGDKRWNPNADVTNDDFIDMSDIGWICLNYGQHE